VLVRLKGSFGAWMWGVSEEAGALEVSMMCVRCLCGLLAALEVSAPSPHHLMGVHAASPSPWRCFCPIPPPWECPCGASITLEVSVPRPHPLMGVHAASPLLWRCFCPISTTLGVSLWCLHHLRGVCPQAASSHGGSCSISIPLEMFLPNFHHLGKVPVVPPSPSRCLSPIPVIPWGFTEYLLCIGDAPTQLPSTWEDPFVVSVALEVLCPVHTIPWGFMQHLHPFGDVHA